MEEPIQTQSLQLCIVSKKETLCSHIIVRRNENFAVGKKNTVYEQWLH